MKWVEALTELSVHALVFAGLLVFFQVLLTAWTWRCSHSPVVTLVTALVPVVGVPYFLLSEKERLRDNHIAGAATYLTLLVSVFGFLLLYPKLMEDDIPWALIHTMQFFGFLGLANMIATQFSDE